MFSKSNGNAVAGDPDGRRAVPPWKFGVSPESMCPDRDGM